MMPIQIGKHRFPNNRTDAAGDDNNNNKGFNEVPGFIYTEDKRNCDEFIFPQQYGSIRFSSCHARYQPLDNKNSFAAFGDHQQGNEKLHQSKLENQYLSPLFSFKSNKYHRITTETRMLDKINIRTIGAALFVGAAIFCLFEIWAMSGIEKPHGRRITSKLKLVNIFSRHGDRSPSDGLPKGDRHAEKIDFFWPNGMTNLTDMGRLRQIRLGLELRRKYRNYLDYNSTSVLALSSPIDRCRESIDWTLRGLYNMEWTRDKGRYLNSSKHDLPRGSGSANEWKLVPIDTNTVPALTYTYLNNCAFRKQHPSPIDSDMTASPDIKSLVGTEQLRQVLKQRYDQDFNFGGLSLFSTIVSEMNIVRTEATIPYASHYLEWVNTPVKGTKNGSKIELFDVFEQVAVFGYRDRVVNEASYVQIGPLITSLIESQLVALNQTNNSGTSGANRRMQAYKGKKMILYSTHDSILQSMLHLLDIIHIDSSFEKRFAKWRSSRDEVGKFLAGLKMSNYGLSVKFELSELEIEGKSKKFPYVQLSIYNKEDPKLASIDYKAVEFGNICRRLFKKRFPRAPNDELKLFYDPEYHIDEKYSCPFSLLRNITSELMIDDERIRQLCDYK